MANGKDLEKINFLGVEYSGYFSPLESNELFLNGVMPDACYKIDLDRKFVRIIPILEMPTNRYNRDIQAKNGIHYFPAIKKPVDVY